MSRTILEVPRMRMFIAYGHWTVDDVNFIVCRCPNKGVSWRLLMRSLHQVIKGFAPETRQGDWWVDGTVVTWETTRFPRHDWQDGRWVQMSKNPVEPGGESV